MRMVKAVLLKLLFIITGSALVMVAAILAIDFHISRASAAYIFTSVDVIPKRQVALILGTSKYVGKRANQFYSHRISATVNLYQSDKINAVLISGDNATRYYNEPITMQKDLIEQGIPSDATTLDYAGFRTYDSVVRAKAIFGQTDLIIVSQRFHVERAVYIARHQDIDAIGYVAKDADQRWHWRVRLRETFARTKMWLDLYILDMKPHFLGESVEVKIPSVLEK